MTKITLLTSNKDEKWRAKEKRILRKTWRWAHGGGKPQRLHIETTRLHILPVAQQTCACMFVLSWGFRDVAGSQLLWNHFIENEVIGAAKYFERFSVKEIIRDTTCCEHIILLTLLFSLCEFTRRWHAIAGDLLRQTRNMELIDALKVNNNHKGQLHSLFFAFDRQYFVEMITNGMYRRIATVPFSIVPQYHRIFCILLNHWLRMV